MTHPECVLFCTVFSLPLIVVAGDDIVLPCQLEPPVDAVQMTIEWGKPDLNPRFVFVWHNGQELQTDQNTAYKGRVSLSIDKLKHGDIYEDLKVFLNCLNTLETMPLLRPRPF
uniref:Immunoglobulin V-set domain-containing protein n=1 Tax=Haplochromis burtoni TaxID=8153 RepID=A0A3Q2W8E0_HAPBU